MHFISLYELAINVINIQDYINYWECHLIYVFSIIFSKYSLIVEVLFH